jgi:hypothetical protein
LQRKIALLAARSPQRALDEKEAELLNQVRPTRRLKQAALIRTDPPDFPNYWKQIPGIFQFFPKINPLISLIPEILCKYIFLRQSPFALSAIFPTPIRPSQDEPGFI